MTSLRPRTRRLRAATGLAVAGLAAALTLTGCSATNDITSEQEYNSSDGVGARVGDIKAINFLIVSAASGEPGALLGALENKGTDDETVTVTLGTDGHEVDVPAGQTVLLGAPGGSSNENEEIIFDTVPVPPGAVAKVVVATESAGSVELDVPVVDGSLPEYADSVPAAG